MFSVLSYVLLFLEIVLLFIYFFNYLNNMHFIWTLSLQFWKTFKPFMLKWRHHLGFVFNKYKCFLFCLNLQIFMLQKYRYKAPQIAPQVFEKLPQNLITKIKKLSDILEGIITVHLIFFKDSYKIWHPRSISWFNTQPLTEKWSLITFVHMRSEATQGIWRLIKNVHKICQNHLLKNKWRLCFGVQANQRS